MKILLLGVGMQGKAALHDLVGSAAVREIVAADQHVEQLKAFVRSGGYGSRVTCRSVDGSDEIALDQLLEEVHPDVVIDLLPVSCLDRVVAAALKCRVHLVNTFYVSPFMEQVAEQVESGGITILPEFGMDPGIDLVLLGAAVRSLDQVTDILTYGGGIPAPEAADNPLQYKISWTFAGVLKSYHRPAHVIRDGRAVRIEPADIFDAEHIHEINIDGLGKLEAFPNGDALRYARILGVDLSRLNTMGRYALRWPGHAAFWRVIAHLHLLDDEPVKFDDLSVDKQRFLTAALEPHLQYSNDEADLGILRVVVKGRRNGEPKQVVYDVIDRRDPQTGFTAMSRLVGFTASLGAQLIGTGKIGKRGILSPLWDVPYSIMKEELGQRGVHLSSNLVNCN